MGDIGCHRESETDHLLLRSQPACTSANRRSTDIKGAVSIGHRPLSRFSTENHLPLQGYETEEDATRHVAGEDMEVSRHTVELHV